METGRRCFSLAKNNTIIIIKINKLRINKKKEAQSTVSFFRVDTLSGSQRFRYIKILTCPRGLRNKTKNSYHPSISMRFLLFYSPGPRNQVTIINISKLAYRRKRCHEKGINQWFSGNLRINSVYRYSNISRVR